MARVLVVDDHASNRELITSLLRYRGHESLEAGDGLEALAEVRRAHPDLVICDILMPTMDGYEFVRQLRADPAIAHTEVIFYTATFLEQEARGLAQSCGVSQVLVKPCEPEQVLQAIDRALAEATPAEPPPDEASFEREHRRLLTDKLVEKADQLARANQRLSALTDLNLQLASERDPEALLEKVCRGARDLIGARYAILGVKDAAHPVLTRVTTSGMADTDATRVKQLRIDVGVPRQVMLERMPRRFYNPGGDPLAVGLSGSYPPVHSALIVPIASLKQAHGWILLIDKLGADSFSEEDERLLAIHAAQAGRIYENGSLYLEMQHSADKLQAEITERRAATERLRESELRFRQLAENIREVFFLIGTDSGQILYISPAYAEVWGRSCESLYADSQSWMASVHPDDLDTVGRGNEERDAAGSFAYEYRIVRPDGGVRWISARGSPIRDARGVVYRIAGIAEDISERKRAEDKIRRLNRVYEVLSGINALIVRVRNRDELFRDACRIAVDVGAFKLAWIGVVDPGLQEGRVVAHHGDDAGHTLAVRLTLRDDLPHSGRPASLALRTRQPVISNDIAADASLAESHADFRARGLRSLAAFPLLVDDRAVGVLALCSAELNAFDADEVKLLLELAGDISFAFDHLQKEDKLNYLAYFDALTGLANSSLLNERLEQAIVAARAEQHTLALALVDLERFETVNHSFGRHGGDGLLKQVAARMGENAHARTQFARIGADHFVVLVPDVRDASEVGRLFDDMYHRWFTPPFHIDARELRIAARIGIALYPNDGANAESLYRNAEAALKKAKASPDRVLFYDTRMTEAVAERLSLENQLRSALEREEFVLHYQPKVDVQARHITGVEALIRWNSPQHGLVPPLEFISLLEETGLIVEVGLWALRRAALDHAAWREQGFAAPRIAVNVSAVQLRRADFVDTVRALLAEVTPPHGIDIELTESLVMEDIEPNIGKLHALRALGMDLAIDDFGTGYSSLAYLSRLPAQVLKIDRAFIMTMLDDPNNMTLVSTMISLAHSLRMEVVAEGVETEEQARMLRLLRCDLIQGFLISRPVPFDAMSALIAKQAIV